MRVKLETTRLTQREHLGNREASYREGNQQGVEHTASVGPKFHPLRHRSIHQHQFLNRTESCWFGKLRLTRGHQRHPSSSGNSLSRPSHHSRSVLLVWRWSVYADGYNRLSTEDDQAEGSLLFDFGSGFFRVRRGL